MLAAMHALHSPLIVSNLEKLVCSRFTALRPPPASPQICRTQRAGRRPGAARRQGPTPAAAAQRPPSCPPATPRCCLPGRVRQGGCQADAVRSPNARCRSHGLVLVVTSATWATCATWAHLCTMHVQAGRSKSAPPCPPTRHAEVWKHRRAIAERQQQAAGGISRYSLCYQQRLALHKGERQRGVHACLFA